MASIPLLKVFDPDAARCDVGNGTADNDDPEEVDRWFRPGDPSWRRRYVEVIPVRGPNNEVSQIRQ